MVSKRTNVGGRTLSALAMVPLLLVAACVTTPASPPVETATSRITAKAWALAEADTGRVVASRGLDAPSKSASITKTMTALLVAEYAAAHPEALDEMVVMSETAAARVGSEAGLEPGERLPVRDMLRALMLPSGNDAGYALAQHFSDRFTPGDTSQDGGGFIAAMNRKAQALGMKDTLYRSAFGDGGTPDDRTTTASDLLILARAASAQPLVREIVATRTWAATAVNAEGRGRYVAWFNTNRMLGLPGATGIKTGTTRLAGACLLTEITVAGVRYHVVVLGSASSEQRYVDTLMILELARPKA